MSLTKKFLPKSQHLAVNQLRFCFQIFFPSIFNSFSLPSSLGIINILGNIYAYVFKDPAWFLLLSLFLQNLKCLVKLILGFALQDTHSTYKKCMYMGCFLSEENIQDGWQRSWDTFSRLRSACMYKEKTFCH